MKKLSYLYKRINGKESVELVKDKGNIQGHYIKNNNNGPGIFYPEENLMKN